MSLTNFNEMLSWVQENEGNYVKLMPLIVCIKSDCTIKVVNFSESSDINENLIASEVTEEKQVVEDQSHKNLEKKENKETLLEYTRRLESRLKSNRFFKA